MNKKYDVLEEEEIAIKTCLEKIDLQFYKKKVIESMAIITEDTKEVEKFVQEKPNLMNADLRRRIKGDIGIVIKEEPSELNETFEEISNVEHEKKKGNYKREAYSRKCKILDKNSGFGHFEAAVSNDANCRNKEKK